MGSGEVFCLFCFVLFCFCFCFFKAAIFSNMRRVKFCLLVCLFFSRTGGRSFFLQNYLFKEKGLDVGWVFFVVCLFVFTAQVDEDFTIISIIISTVDDFFFFF